MESAPAPVRREEPPMTIILRPQEKEWIMGEDIEMKISPQTSFTELKAKIEEMKGISRYRIQIRLKGKLIVPNRENWTLRRTGIYDGYVICIEPTISGAWYWNSYDYYVDKLIAQVYEVIMNSPNHRILLKDLEPKIFMPPIFKTSLRVLLRQYPERIFIYVDTTNNNVWIQKSTKHLQLPVFDPNPIELGHIVYYQPKPFDWEAYADIDDMLKLEEFDPMLGSSSLDKAGPDGEGVPGELAASLDGDHPDGIADGQKEGELAGESAGEERVGDFEPAAALAEEMGEKAEEEGGGEGAANAVAGGASDDEDNDA